MARGRVITPEFWTDGNMIGLSALARLFYIGLWNHAYCDNGHLPDDPMGLKLRILPTDDVDPRTLIAELEGRGRLARVESDGRTFLFMPTFSGHQKRDTRWKTRCPACALADSLELTETQVSSGVPTETHQTSALTREESTGENQREPEKNPVAPSVLESVFDQAWSHWPKKVEKKAALDKFKLRLKGKPIESAHALAATISKFGDAYASTTEKKFTPALGVWINGERWTDELPGATAAPAASKPADWMNAPRETPAWMRGPGVTP